MLHEIVPAAKYQHFSLSSQLHSFEISSNCHQLKAKKLQESKKLCAVVTTPDEVAAQHRNEINRCLRGQGVERRSTQWHRSWGATRGRQDRRRQVAETGGARSARRRRRMRQRYTSGLRLGYPIDPQCYAPFDTIVLWVDPMSFSTRILILGTGSLGRPRKTYILSPRDVRPQPPGTRSPSKTRPYPAQPLGEPIATHVSRTW